MIEPVNRMFRFFYALETFYHYAGGNPLLPTCTHWDSSHQITLLDNRVYAIFSPHFPNNYLNYLSCNWFIQTESDHLVHFAVKSLNLSETGDWLYIGDGNVPKENTLVELDVTIKNALGVTSKTNNVWVMFQSDDRVTAPRGFFLGVSRIKNTGTLLFLLID